MEIIRIEDLNHPQFQLAFKQYFIELGLDFRQEDYDDIFSQMNEQDGNFAYIAIEADVCVGFIQGRKEEFNHWFFSYPFGFIREFWVHPQHREKGLGTQLLKTIELDFFNSSLQKVILTSDTEVEFYQHHGYQIDSSIRAENEIFVLVKTIK